MNNIGTTIKQILKFRGSDQRQLAEKAGYKSQSNITGLLNHGNMRIDNFLRLIDALDCEVVVRDKNSKQEWYIQW